MGGMTLAVRAKTGVDPSGYFNDLRRPGAAQAATSVSALREEARTTIWNPKFIRGMQGEGASAAASLTESVRNLYGWNVMQPSAVSQDMWDETYDVMIADKHDLNTRQYFEQKNPYALQNMTAIMLETARKGYWTPAAEVLQNLAVLHTQLIEQFGAGCSYETCGNHRLHEFIEGTLTAPGSEAAPEAIAAYQASLSRVLQSSQPLPDVEGIAMQERVEPEAAAVTAREATPTLWLAGLLLVGTIGLLTAGYQSSGTASRSADISHLPVPDK
jgi:cobaltochelatase CobN